MELHYDHTRLRSEIIEKTYRNHFGEKTAWYALDFHALRMKARYSAGFFLNS